MSAERRADADRRARPPREPEREHRPRDRDDGVDEQESLGPRSEEGDVARPRARPAIPRASRRCCTCRRAWSGRLPAGAREHRLLERRERPGLDDFRRDRARRAARTRSQVASVSAKAAPASPITTNSPAYQRRRPTRSPVRATATDASATPASSAAEDQPDLETRQAAAGERDADEHAAEAIGKRSERLGDKDAAGVAGQARPAISFRHHA